jgi:hypothetical protein
MIGKTETVEDLIAKFTEPTAGADAVWRILLKGREALPALRHALQSPNPMTHGFAALAIADFDEPDGDELLIDLLREFDYSAIPGPLFFVWEGAALRAQERLEQGRDLDVVEPMIAALERSIPGMDDFWDLREEAMNTLAEVRGLQDERVKRLLLDAAARDSAFLLAPLAITVLEGMDPQAAEEARRIYRARPDAEPDV